MDQSDMLGCNALYTGSYRHIGEGYCLLFRTGLQLQFLPVFTAFYSIRRENFNSAFLYKLSFLNIKLSVKSLIQRNEKVCIDVALPGT